MLKSTDNVEPALLNADEKQHERVVEKWHEAGERQSHLHSITNVQCNFFTETFA